MASAGAVVDVAMEMMAEEQPRILLEMGLLSVGDFFGRGCEICSAGRRNQNFVVRTNGDDGFFIKYPRRAEDAPIIEHERTVSQYLAANGIAQYVPEVCGPLAGCAGAVYRLEKGATLARVFGAEGRLLSLPSKSVGSALAATHRIAPPSFCRHPVIPLPLMLPCPPIALFQTFSAAGRELLRVVQEHNRLMEGLERVAEDWRADSLIHGDVKWDNILVRHAGASRRTTGIVLADWELAGLGDWRWDVGSFVSDYLRHWLLSFPVVESYAPDLLLGQAQFPLEPATVSIRAFMAAYSRRRGMPIDAVDLMPFVASRLVQSAFEMTSGAVPSGGEGIVDVTA